MEVRPRENDPDIGTAWLVLAHAPFIGAAIAASALSVTLALFVFETTRERRGDRTLQALAIAWNVVCFLIATWTVYAIALTWRTAQRYREQIFGNFAFGTLMLIVVAMAAVNAWSCCVSARHACTEYRARRSPHLLPVYRHTQQRHFLGGYS